MPETENIVNMNLTSSIEQASNLIEQLAKAYAELEAQEDASCDSIKWKDIEGHFRYLESLMKKRLVELEAKEKEVTEKESLLAERESEVIVKEQVLLDRVQELKDAAVAAILEAKVSCSVNDENSDQAQAQAVAAELTRFCERMDSKGLLNYVTENLNDISSVCRKELSRVLSSATEPARLVLDALEGFFPPSEMTQNVVNSGDALNVMRQSCLLIMEALCAFLAKADSSVDKYLNTEIKHHAKAMADKWKPNLALESTDAATGKSLEARAFLRLLVTFRIASEFDEEELCKYVLATAHHRQGTELCRSLDLAQKIPGIVETLLKDGRNIEAANFILTFQLSEAFPPVPLLKAYLKETRRKLQGNGDAETQNDFNARELTAVKAVMRCVKEYKLESEFPLDTLRKRFVQLQNAVWDRKRKRENRKIPKKELYGNKGFQEASASENGRQNQPFSSQRAAYTGLTNYSSAAAQSYSYPVASQSTYTSAYSYSLPSQSTYTAQAINRSAYSYSLPSQSTYTAEANVGSAYNYSLSSHSTYTAEASDRGAYSYSLPSQSTYTTEANDQRSYYYAQGDKASAPYAAAPSAYSAYMQPPQPPHM